MRKIAYLFAAVSLTLSFAACSSEEIVPQPSSQPVEIAVGVDNYSVAVFSTRATDAGSIAESAISNLYLFLFDVAGANPAKYYIDGATFTGGTYSAADKKISLSMTQAAAGTRQVYIVANCDNDLKAQLDAVTTKAALQTVFSNTPQPWSAHIDSPVLMSGQATHDFVTQGHQLNSVHLIRAVAKVELNVKLSEGFQVVPTITGENLTEYKYRYVDFDTRTYVEKPATKPDNLASSSADAWPNIGGWTPWGAALNNDATADAGAGYTLTNGKVTGLKLITYLNERDAAGAAVQIVLPRVDNGPLPPPEFGPELFALPLPDKITRNTWYIYHVEI